MILPFLLSALMQVVDMIITGDDIDGISILKTKLAKL
jgi:hypothetical protein